jgi:2-polyprenyl-3-methyl-5-hydroxy-6-metoxy-1,4-benzoquinol methylase
MFNFISKPSQGRCPPPAAVTSQLCKYEDFETPWFQKWKKRLRFDDHDSAFLPKHIQFHRKAWEFALIPQALEERGCLDRENAKGLGFAVGREFLPSYFASRGIRVTATDAPVSNTSSATWGESSQHSSEKDHLFYPDLVNRKQFDKCVKFKPVDMLAIKGLKKGSFDFIWSACSFEHLGNLDAGLEFVVKSCEFLKPGGVAVHTTEYNLTSDDQTIDQGGFVIYRKRDLEALDRLLRRRGFAMEPMDLRAGFHEYDIKFDTPPYYESGLQHVKLQLGDYVSTSCSIVIHA